MKLHNRNAQVRVLALIALLSASYASADSQQRAWAGAKQIPAAAVACYFVGRAFLSADFSQGEVVGYFTDINGIGAADSLFNGNPGERSAYFTDPHTGNRVFEVPNSHRHRDHEIVMTSSGAPCLPAAAVRCHRADVLQ